MRQQVVVIIRSLTRLIRQTSTAFAILVFLSLTGALFANNLFLSEGTSVSVPSIWALSVAGVLPLLTALPTMRLWSDDGVAEHMECDLVVPVPERVFAQGRFVAAYIVVFISILFALAVPLLILSNSSPVLADQLKVVRFLPALVVLLIFAMPLTAIGSMTGALFKNAVPAAVTAISLTCVIPFAIYRALIAWSPVARTRFAEAPVFTHIAGAADGFLSFGFVVVSLAITLIL